jgi:hypothetical protein
VNFATDVEVAARNRRCCRRTSRDRIVLRPTSSCRLSNEVSDTTLPLAIPLECQSSIRKREREREKERERGGERVAVSELARFSHARFLIVPFVPPREYSVLPEFAVRFILESPQVCAFIPDDRACAFVRHTSSSTSFVRLITQLSRISSTRNATRSCDRRNREGKP